MVMMLFCQTWTSSVLFSCFSLFATSRSFSLPPFSFLFPFIKQTNNSIQFSGSCRKNRGLPISASFVSNGFSLSITDAFSKNDSYASAFAPISHIIQQRKIPIVVVYPVQAHALLPNAVLADYIVVESHLVSHERIFLEVKRHALIIFVLVESLPRGYWRTAAVGIRVD